MRAARRYVAVVVVSGSLVLMAASSGRASASGGASMTVTLYASPTKEQFLNHADDRARGNGSNPFGNFSNPVATTKEHGNGPFPGDQAVFNFNLFAGPVLTKAAGAAVFVCTYNFAHNGLCEGAYQLGRGTLYVKGPLDFDAKTFSLAVVGGTGNYAHLTGSLTETPTRTSSRRAASQRTVLSLHRVSGPRHTLALQSVTTSEVFLNHADDRKRGGGNNPFGNFISRTATTGEKSGPYPGDQAIFTFDVYAGAKLRTRAGSAVFRCIYAFKRLGFCDAIYNLSGGTVVAEGAFSFDTTTYAMTVTGGTGRYASAAGEVAAGLPTSKKSQPVVIGLV